MIILVLPSGSLRSKAILDDRYLGDRHTRISRDLLALRTSISLELRNVAFGRALRTIADKVQITLIYNESVLPIDQKVSVSRQTRTAIEALKTVLKQTGADYIVSKTGQIMIIPATSKLKTGTSEASAVKKSDCTAEDAEVAEEKSKVNNSHDGKYF